MVDGAPAAKEATDDRYSPGQEIAGKYRLVRPLGTGGFGHVWVALNVVLEVHVALKFIYDDTDGRRRSGARLLQEARAAAQLGHPAIVRVFDFGETARGDPFVAMELLNGETLADLLARETRLTPARAIQLMLPIADALATAHAKGIVHRDVKPENIFIARDDVGRIQPKLLDFGIARVGPSRSLTARGAVLGTPDYMAPEQANGSDASDARTDVWAFSVVLYELITGVLPFDGANCLELLQNIIHEEPLSTVSRGAGDEELWLLLRTGLAKKQHERWDSLRIYGEALALWLYDHGVQEDACAASLRSSWLEAEFSDVHIVLPSSPPEAGRRTMDEAPAPPPISPAAAPAPPPATPAQPRRTIAAAAAVGLIVVAVVGTIVALSSRSEATAPTASSVAASGSIAPATPDRPAPVAEPAAEAPSSTAPVAVKPVAPMPAKVKTPPPATPNATPAKAPKAKPRPTSGKDIDLGF